MTDRIEVLHDGGFVRLVDHMGNDLTIVRSARVSYDADWRAGEDEDKDHKLIKYLWRNKHTSPFEAVTFTFEIKCPIFIRGQWHRHRTWAYNEISARYAPLDEGHYTPKPEMIGVQSVHNKQMRDLGELDNTDDPNTGDELYTSAHRPGYFTWAEAVAYEFYRFINLGAHNNG